MTFFGSNYRKKWLETILDMNIHTPINKFTIYVVQRVSVKLPHTTLSSCHTEHTLFQIRFYDVINGNIVNT